MFRQACETQLKMLPVGLDNLNLIPEEARKAIYDASRKPPEGYETKANQITDNNKDSVRSQVNFDCSCAQKERFFIFHSHFAG